jgi:disulfide bond formation protein DsbB
VSYIKRKKQAADKAAIGGTGDLPGRSYSDGGILMKQASRQQNNVLGCYIQSAIGGTVLLAVFAIAFNVLASAVNTSPETNETVVEAAAIVPTQAPTAVVIQPTAVPPTATLIPPTTIPTSAPTAVPTAAQVVQAEAASGATGAYDSAAVANGQATFGSLCIACHGADARGLPNLGKDLVTSEFVHGLTDQELLDFIKTGRPMWDPLNTTGVDMPPRGGNPALTDEQLLNIVAYLRSLSPS